jgi:putative ABC transport system permease protein
MAERHWPGESPLGRRLSVDNPATRPVWFTVVGVVKDSRQSGWVEDMRDEMYFPHFAAEGRGSVISFLNPVSMTLVIRSALPPRELLPAVRAAVQSLDRDAPVSDVITLEQAVEEQFAAPRFYLSLMGGFALLALILAAVGIYGVMSYSVARRSHEIGIRLALGADRRDAFRLVVGQGLRLAALGGVAGVIGALALSRFIQSLLFGVGPSDPLTFAAVAVLLTLVALVAAAIPARRAARVNPIVALRSE